MEKAFEPTKIELDDGFAVEFQVVSPFDERINAIDDRVAVLNKEIYRLTNHADGIDYAISVTSGIITGIIDSVFIGEWNFNKARIKSKESLNRKVIAFAQKHGYTGERLDEAIIKLEKKFPLPGDGAYKSIQNTLTGKVDIITNHSHHLDDFCHHPTLVGLVCCVIVQFTGQTIYFDKNSTFYQIPITVNPNNGQFQGTNLYTKFFCGIINWFINAAHTIKNAHGHWMSDIVGSGSSKKGGMGLPGSVMSLLKELSALPIMNQSNFAENLDKAFRNGIGTGNKQIDLTIFNPLFAGAQSNRVDIRTENAIFGELKRQAIPVLINEVLVRSFYFIRHLVREIKNNQINSFRDFTRLNWQSILPFRNRTITRMLTIATGTFTAVDLADAAIRSAITSSGNAAVFATKFILRVNFVGIGRFAIAVGTDVSMGIKKSRLENERLQLLSEQLFLMNARFFYHQENTWIQIEATQRAMNDLQNYIDEEAAYLLESYSAIDDDIRKIGTYVQGIEKHNPGLIDELLQIMKY